MKKIFLTTIILSLGVLLPSCSTSGSKNTVNAEVARENEAFDALQKLYTHTPGARALGNSAKAILIFPEITKAGFLVGGQYGTGVLIQEGRVTGYYRSTAASYGLQAGVQKFGYALFFMTEDDLSYLSKSEGWEIGVGPSITIVDHGMAKSFTTTTGRKGVYAFFFEQRGLMAGLGIQGTKITKTESLAG